MCVSGTRSRLKARTGKRRRRRRGTGSLVKTGASHSGRSAHSAISRQLVLRTDDSIFSPPPPLPRAFQRRFFINVHNYDIHLTFVRPILLNSRFPLTEFTSGVESKKLTTFSPLCPIYLPYALTWWADSLSLVRQQAQTLIWSWKGKKAGT